MRILLALALIGAALGQTPSSIALYRGPVDFCSMDKAGKWTFDGGAKLDCWRWLMHWHDKSINTPKGVSLVDMTIHDHRLDYYLLLLAKEIGMEWVCPLTLRLTVLTGADVPLASRK